MKEVLIIILKKIQVLLDIVYSTVVKLSYVWSIDLLMVCEKKKNVWIEMKVLHPLNEMIILE